MNIKINSEEELVELFRELLHISVNMRHWQVEWHEKYGVELGRIRKHWEKRMDIYLEQLGARYGTSSNESIKFEMLNNHE